MITALTEARIIELSERLGKSAVLRAPFKVRLEGIPTQAILEGIPTQAILEGIPTQAILEGIPTQAILEGIPTQAILEAIPAEAVYDFITPEGFAVYVQRLPEEKRKLFQLCLNQAGSA